MSQRLDIFVDGGSSGNPGPAGIGVVILKGTEKIKEISQDIGETTNNVAEYTALIYALQQALVLKAENIKVHTDSELVYSQIIGKYRIKDEKLKPLFDQVQHLKSGIKQFEIVHIPREQNIDADALAKKAIKKKQAKVVAPTVN